MLSYVRRSLSILSTVLLLMGFVTATEGAQKGYFSRFDTLEVDEFENIDAIGEQGGIRPPPVVLDAARRDIIQRVLELHLFRHVAGIEDGRAKGGQPGTLRLSGETEVFNSNVRKGGGKGTLKLKIKIVDEAENKTFFEGSVSAKISAWVNKPLSEVTATEIGKQVADIIKKNW